jgi:hypothetical protein
LTLRANVICFFFWKEYNTEILVPAPDPVVPLRGIWDNIASQSYRFLLLFLEKEECNPEILGPAPDPVVPLRGIWDNIASQS